MGVRIVLADNEQVAVALRRFKKLLERLGVSRDMLRRGFFIKPTQKRRRKRFRKRFKARMAMLLAKKAGKQRTSSVSEAGQTFWKKTGKP